jgi:hypothetical protein
MTAEIAGCRIYPALDARQRGIVRGRRDILDYRDDEFTRGSRFLLDFKAFGFKYPKSLR